jgi:hypothetical protein
MLNKLFPNVNFEKIQYDKEGLYSITHHDEADIISEIIINNFDNKENLKILDGTGGLGGNTISFSKFFKNVTSIELDKNRCDMLKNNIKLYNLNNIKIINDDSIKFLLGNKENYDIYFFDPPWGGPDYKKIKNLRLKIGNYKLSELSDKISLNNKLLVFKLPFNYDFEEFSNFNYKLYKINKYYIIILLL